MRTLVFFLPRVVLITLVLATSVTARASDSLPSWNDGPAKQSIVDFVQRVTTSGSADFVPEPERIAVFDNDGTLWAEQPIYFQFAFALDRIRALAPEHPEWKETQPLAEQVLEDCASELGSYCQSVTPGEGRLLACLYAHGDKLSGQCEFALYDAAVRLERAISALTYVASECRADIESLCAGVQMGEGRIAQCRNEHSADLSEPCDRAIADVGLKD